MNSLRPTEAEAVRDWAALVAADAEQVPRVREPEPARDHYQQSAPQFRAGVRPSPEMSVLSTLVEPGESWLDISAGGGRLAVPLAQLAGRVIAVEPSAAMRDELRSVIEEQRVPNIDIRDARWPDPTWSETVDVSLAAHSLYDIGAIAPFLDAMERHSRRLCVALLRPWARGGHLARLFEAVHGEPMCALPALREFVALLGARGRRYEVRAVPIEAEAAVMPRERAFPMARTLLWLAEGSAKEQRMRSLMEEWWGTPAGIAFPPAPAYIGVVSWTPPAPAGHDARA